MKRLYIYVQARQPLLATPQNSFIAIDVKARQTFCMLTGHDNAGAHCNDIAISGVVPSYPRHGVDTLTLP